MGDPRQARPAPPAAPVAQDTESRILTAFLRLAAARGLARVTTRDVAREAGVNEVTIFRHFGDKARLTREAVRRFSPADELAALDPQVDGGDPARAEEGLMRCLRNLADRLRVHPELVRFGLSEAARTAELPAILAIPRAVHGFLLRALRQAKPALRPEVSVETTALQWMGLLLVSRLLADSGLPIDASPPAMERHIAAAVRAVVRGGHNERGEP